MWYWFPYIPFHDNNKIENTLCVTPIQIRPRNGKMTWVGPISFVAKKANAYLVYCVKLSVECIDLLGGTHINNTWSPKAHHNSLQPNKDWQKIQPNFVASAVPADNLAPSHAWAPPVTIMTTLALADIKYVYKTGARTFLGASKYDDNDKRQFSSRGWSLVQAMTWRVHGAKPLAEPMLSYCQQCIWRKIFQNVKFSGINVLVLW